MQPKRIEVQEREQLVTGEPVASGQLTVKEVGDLCFAALLANKRIKVPREGKRFIVLSIVTDDDTDELTHLKVDVYPARGES